MSRAWMPMYWGDYLADTAHFTNAEHGCYLLLISFYWTNGKLPDNEDGIRRIAKCSAHQWKKIRPVLVEKFSIENRQWKHKRIDAELAQVAEKTKAARARAMQRWQCNSHSHSESELDKKEKKEGTAVAVSSSGHSPNHFFETGVIRLSERDFRKWEAAFSNLDLRAELIALTEWARGQPKWFFAVSGALAKRNREMGLRLKIEGAKANGMETDRERRKRESREALAQLRAFGEGRTNGDFGGEVVQLLPRTGTSGGSEDISGGGN